MPRNKPNLTLPDDGTCGFCGKSRREARALVGSPVTDVRICDGCVGLCCAILAEQAKVLEKAPKAFQFSEAEVARGRLPQVSAADFPDELLVEINAALAAHGPATTRPSSAEFRCSFCDARHVDVPKLVSGPRVFICNKCVTQGVAAIKGARGA